MAVRLACVLAVVVTSRASPVELHARASDTVSTVRSRRSPPHSIVRAVQNVFTNLLPHARSFLPRGHFLSQHTTSSENSTTSHSSKHNAMKRFNVGPGTARSRVLTQNNTMDDQNDVLSHYISQSVADHSIKEATADKDTSRGVSSYQGNFSVDALRYFFDDLTHSREALSSKKAITDKVVPQDVAQSDTMDDTLSHNISQSVAQHSVKEEIADKNSSPSVSSAEVASNVGASGHSPQHQIRDEDVSDSIAEDSDDMADDFFYDIARQVKIVLWTDFAPFSTEWVEHKAPGCHITAPYMANKSTSMHPDYDISDADVVVVNLAELERYYSLPRHKREGQLWVATCWEPNRFSGGSSKAGVLAADHGDDARRDMIGDCSLLDSKETMSWFDAVASYDNSSDFPAFFTPPPENVLRRSVPNFKERGPELATVAIKDCRWNQRNEFVKSINASLTDCHLPGSILSYGNCMHNAEEAACDGPSAIHVTDSDMSDEQLMWFSNRCASRPFQIVVENTNAPWYVTEKIWNALASGAVPVYLGSDDARKLVPPNSTIFASDYNSTETLAESLLLNYERGLMEYHAWKNAPVSHWGGWRGARRLSRATLPARLCAFAGKRPVVKPLGAGKLGRENKSPTVNPEQQKLGKGFRGAMRRALAGLAAEGSTEAKDLLDRARATRQQTGVWPIVTPPPYEQALGLSVEPQTANSTKEPASNESAAAAEEHEADVRAMDSLWTRITSGQTLPPPPRMSAVLKARREAAGSL